MDEQLRSEAQGYKSGETHIRPSTPIRVKAAPYDEAVKITWALGDELNLFGYYVLRGPNPQTCPSSPMRSRIHSLWTRCWKAVLPDKCIMLFNPWIWPSSSAIHHH